MSLRSEQAPDNPHVPGWESSLGRHPDGLPDPLRRIMHRLCQPHPDDRPHFSTMEIADDVHLAWRIRAEFGLNDRVEDVLIRRGTNTYYIRFHPTGFSTDRQPFENPPGYDASATHC